MNKSRVYFIFLLFASMAAAIQPGWLTATARRAAQDLTDTESGKLLMSRFGDNLPVGTRVKAAFVSSRGGQPFALDNSIPASPVIYVAAMHNKLTHRDLIRALVNYNGASSDGAARQINSWFRAAVGPIMQPDDDDDEPVIVRRAEPAAPAILLTTTAPMPSIVLPAVTWNWGAPAAAATAAATTTPPAPMLADSVVRLMPIPMAPFKHDPFARVWPEPEPFVVQRGRRAPLVIDLTTDSTTSSLSSETPEQTPKPAVTPETPNRAAKRRPATPAAAQAADSAGPGAVDLWTHMSQNDLQLAEERLVPTAHAQIFDRLGLTLGAKLGGGTYGCAFSVTHGGKQAVLKITLEGTGKRELRCMARIERMGKRYVVPTTSFARLFGYELTASNQPLLTDNLDGFSDFFRASLTKRNQKLEKEAPGSSANIMLLLMPRYERDAFKVLGSAIAAQHSPAEVIDFVGQTMVQVLAQFATFFACTPVSHYFRHHDLGLSNIMISGDQFDHFALDMTTTSGMRLSRLDLHYRLTTCAVLIDFGSSDYYVDDRSMAAIEGFVWNGQSVLNSYTWDWMNDAALLVAAVIRDLEYSLADSKSRKRVVPPNYRAQFQPFIAQLKSTLRTLSKHAFYGNPLKGAQPERRVLPSEERPVFYWLLRKAPVFAQWRGAEVTDIPITNLRGIWQRGADIGSAQQPVPMSAAISERLLHTPLTAETLEHVEAYHRRPVHD